MFAHDFWAALFVRHTSDKLLYGKYSLSVNLKPIDNMLSTDEEKHSVLSTESFVPYVMDVYTSARSKDVVVHLIPHLENMPMSL